jgi:NOL1/NOP2/fmu family ribosome biogenesis protein
MDKLRILNTRKVKSVLRLLEEQWGYKGKLDYVFLINTKSKLFMVGREFSGVDTSVLRVNSIGMYFGELATDGLLLSIEGSQLVGPYANRNVLELSDEEKESWLRGDEQRREASGYVLLRHGRDFLGCGKATQGRIMNYVPKNRRITQSSI